MSLSQSEKVKGTCDIMFLLDASGSMAPCIDALMENIAVFVQGMQDPQAPEHVGDWRCTVWGYRDVVADKDRWLVSNPFVRDVAGLRAQLGDLRARGGGDEPESLLDALYKAATLPASDRGQPEDPVRWRYRSAAARVIIVFSDASFHPTMSIPEAAGGSVQDVINAITANRFATVFYAPGFACYDDLSVMDKAEFEQICGGDDPDPPKAMANYTQDKANFAKALAALAKTVTKSAVVEAL